MIPLSTPTGVRYQFACYVGTNTELSTSSWRKRSRNTQVLREKKADVGPAARGECKTNTKNRVSFDWPDSELACPSDGKDIVSDDVSSVRGNIIIPCPLEIIIEDSGIKNSTKNFATSKKDICTAKKKPCVSWALYKKHRTFDPGGPGSTTKVDSSGVLCMDVYRMRL